MAVPTKVNIYLTLTMVAITLLFFQLTMLNYIEPN